MFHFLIICLQLSSIYVYRFQTILPSDLSEVKACLIFSFIYFLLVNTLSINRSASLFSFFDEARHSLWSRYCGLIEGFGIDCSGVQGKGETRGAGTDGRFESTSEARGKVEHLKFKSLYIINKDAH